jgi:hypothetical protein
MNQLILDTAWTFGLIAVAIVTAAAYNAVGQLIVRHRSRAEIRAMLRRLGQVERDVDAARATRERLLAEARLTIPTQRQPRKDQP